MFFRSWKWTFQIAAKELVQSPVWLYSALIALSGLYSVPPSNAQPSTTICITGPAYLLASLHCSGIVIWWYRFCTEGSKMPHVRQFTNEPCTIKNPAAERQSLEHAQLPQRCSCVVVQDSYEKSRVYSSVAEGFATQLILRHSPKQNRVNSIQAFFF